MTRWDCNAEYLELLKLSLMDVLGHETFTADRVSVSEVLISPLPEERRQKRLDGADWPANGMTMVGKARLDNLQHCIETVLSEGTPGDLIETGVWRGGATILMRAVLQVHGVTDRMVWVADSFEGLPPADPEKYPGDARMRLHQASHLAVPLEEVKRNFRRYRMLDDQVRFIKGWFSETLPGLRDRQWSVVRLDGDLYESTMVALENLYPSLAPGGFLIIDDYWAIGPCRRAVEDYRARHGIRENVQQIDWSGIFWRKEQDVEAAVGQALPVT